MSSPFYSELDKQQLEEPLNDVEAFLNCARYNEDDDVELLQNYLDRYPENIDARDEQGRTAVHMAAANGHMKILEVLFRFSPRPDLSNREGNTALHFAALNNRVSAAKLLLRKGWKANAVNIFNRTPLHLIQERGFEEMETVLLCHDPTLDEPGDMMTSVEEEDAAAADVQKEQENNDNEEEESHTVRSSNPEKELPGACSAAGVAHSSQPVAMSKFPTPVSNSEALLGFSRVDEVE
ncbi:unnamed protein product [Phytomonas sp. EM1]|nr:unnamed protein product [Phytomonas sp. EM1]|eukprot:CCW62403.1 unnamed protein product [Phytomonas sp. isolate EM1]